MFGKETFEKLKHAILTQPEVAHDVEAVRQSHSEHSVVRYAGWTIMTLKDGVDGDWSALAKPGFYLNEPALRLTSVPFEELVAITSRNSREEAFQEAKTKIDTIKTEGGYKRTAKDFIDQYGQVLPDRELKFLRSLSNSPTMEQTLRFVEIQGKLCSVNSGV